MKATDMMPIEQLVADILATFPLLEAQQRVGYGSDLTRWMICGEENAVMPDGLPIFRDGSEDDGYTFGAHDAFAAWLVRRGWYLERNDNWWFVPTELPTNEELAQWAAERKAYEFATQGPQLPLHLDPLF